MQNKVVVVSVAVIAAIVALAVYTYQSSGVKTIPFDPKKSEPVKSPPVSAGKPSAVTPPKPATTTPPRSEPVTIQPPRLAPRTDPIVPSSGVTPSSSTPPPATSAPPVIPETRAPTAESHPAIGDNRPTAPEFRPIEPSTRPAPPVVTPPTTSSPPPSPTPAVRPQPETRPPTTQPALPPARLTPPSSVATPPKKDAPATPVPGATAADKPKGTGKKYVVQEADTLSYIAREEYGDDKYWSAIAAANPGINPDHLLIGQSLVLPAKDEVVKPAVPAKSEKPAPPSATPPAATPTKPTTRPAAGNGSAAKPGTPPPSTPLTAIRSGGSDTTYKVGKGDSLIAIARKALKDENRWREIYNLNKDKLSSPDDLKEGMELKLPSAEKPAPTTRKSGR